MLFANAQPNLQQNKIHKCKSQFINMQVCLHICEYELGYEIFRLLNL